VRRATAAGLLLACLAGAAPARAADHVVDDDRAQCPAATFTTITAAVGAAAAGDTVTVCDGSYPGALTINEAVTVRGLGAGSVTTGAATLSGGATLSGVTVTGVTVAAGSAATLLHARVAGDGVSAAGTGALRIEDTLLERAGVTADAREVGFARSWVIGGATTGVSGDELTVTDSLITNATTGVHVLSSGTVSGSSLAGNGTALRNDGPGTVMAERNWWGSAAGPGVVPGADVTPWLTAPPLLPVPPGTPDVPDAPPTAAIAGPTRAFEDARPFDIVAEAADDRGVRTVVLRLGEREACRLTAAPYRCTVEPLGTETGPQPLIAIVTDTGGQTVVATRRYRVGRFMPVSLSHLSRGLAGRIVSSGRMRLPAGISAGDACFGFVEIAYQRGRRSLGTRRARVRSNCTYRLTRRLRRGAYRVKPRMVGNDVLLPVKGKQRRVVTR
jgi:hypothetical protein